MERWQNHVCDEIDRLSRRYDRIYLVGHSMGCLLAVNAAVEYPVCGMMLIACPFKLRTVSARALSVRLRQVFCSKSHPMKAAYLDSRGVPLRIGLIRHSAKPAAQLRRLIISAKANLPNVSVPVTAVYSAADEVVSLSSLETLRIGLGQVPLDEIILSDSLHAYYPEHEHVIIENALLRHARIS
jgi:carboxylesterase